MFVIFLVIWWKQTDYFLYKVICYYSALEYLHLLKLLIILNSADSSFLEGQIMLRDFSKRACTKLMKVLVALQSKHPYSFGDQTVLPAVLDFCLNKITNPEPTVASFEQFLIQCMVLIKSILECKEYKPTLTGRVIDGSVESLSLEQRKKSIAMAVGDILNTVLPSECITLLCNILIRRWLLYWTFTHLYFFFDLCQ